MAHRPDSLVVRSRVADAIYETQKRAFLNALKKVYTVLVAAEIVGLNPSTLYRWRKNDQQFAEDWDNAIAFGAESMESATYLKLAGVLTDDRKRIAMPEAKLIELFLAGAKPEKYRQRTIEIDNTQNHITIDWSIVPDPVIESFNRGELTLKDVYEATLQSEKSSEHSTSPDRRAERSGET